MKNERSSMAGKIGGTLVLLMFGLVFLGISLFDATPELISLLSRWNQARSYVATPASVRSTELKIIRNDTVLESVQANFAYRFRGHDYTSNRVSISNMADDFDSYHRTVHARLSAAQAAGQQVTIWVDPAHPERALYDRAFRLKPVLFMLPFAVLFPLIGLVALFAICLVWRGEPAQGRAALPGELRAQSRPGRMALLAVAIIAFFWNVLSWPIATLAILQALESEQYLGWLAAIFPLAGIGLVAVAGAMWRERWRIGRPMLEVLQTPVHDRLPLRGRIHFTPPFASRLGKDEAVHPLLIVVKLQRTVDAGENTVETTLWENCVLDTVLARGATEVAFSATIPAGLPSAESALPATLDWSVEVQALGTVACFALPEAATSCATL